MTNLELYDELGYELKIELSDTYNPKKANDGEDGRDLGVLIRYVGAVNPECENTHIEKDGYALTRLEFPFEGEWNYQAARDTWGPEEGGAWSMPMTRIYVKDPGIRKSGLRFEYYVSEKLAAKKPVMTLSINGEEQKKINLETDGIFTEILDVTGVGVEKAQYLSDAHRILKILINDFDRVCRKYNLRYYLICGSLLGSQRHKDLIPWDDDVDVAMPRKDFEELLKHVDEEWGEGKDIRFLEYNNLGDKVFLDFMTRIIYMKEEIPTGIFRKIKGRGRTDIENHMPMDIYILENASDTEWKHTVQTQVIRGLYGLAMGHRTVFNPSDYENRDKGTQNIVKFLRGFGKIVPLSLTFRLYEWVRKWNQNKKCENYFESNGFIYCIPWKFKQEWFEEGKRVKLGEVEVSAPKDTEAFLHMHYKDYTQYPPMNMRIPTHDAEASGIF